MKKIIGLTIAAITAFSTAAAAAGFSDSSGHWAESYINVLAERGIVNGITDTEFEPEGTVTRAQYLKMMMEAVGIQPVEFRYGECLDAKAGDWYAPYLQAALDAGLIPESMIAGCNVKVEYEVDESGKATSSKVTYSGAFNGDLPITREEMAVLTQYLYQYSKTVLTDDRTEYENTAAEEFTDSADISDWAKVSVSQAVENGFITGMDDGTFLPRTTATRAQAAAIIYRVING